MNAHVLDCLVTGYESLIEGVSLPDKDDRHVAAAAIRAGAAVIVTFNLKDFPVKALAPLGIEAQHPDEFVTHLLDLSPGKVCAAVKRHRASLKNPRKSAAEYLDCLSKQQLPEFVARLREFHDVI